MSFETRYSLSHIAVVAVLVVIVFVQVEIGFRSEERRVDFDAVDFENAVGEDGTTRHLVERGKRKFHLGEISLILRAKNRARVNTRRPACVRSNNARVAGVRTARASPSTFSPLGGYYVSYPLVIAVFFTVIDDVVVAVRLALVDQFRIEGEHFATAHAEHSSLFEIHFLFGENLRRLLLLL